MGQSTPGPRATGRCPVCGAPSDSAVRPFCTSRCANVDLLRWLRGGYVIEGREDADEDGMDDVGEPMQADRQAKGVRHEDE